MATSHAGPVLSHWSTLLENFQASALEFYARVEEAVTRRQLPDTKTSRVEYKESGLLSANREYLRVERGKDVYDICAAPFGQGYFFSTWLTRKTPGILASLGFLVVYFVLFFVAWVMVAIVFNIVGLDGFTGAVITVFVMIPLAPFILVFLAEQWGPENVVDLPVVGPVYAWIFHPPTYYRHDTAAMFQKSVHNAVLEAIDELTTAKGVRALAPEDRKPVMAGFLNSAA